MSAEELRFSKAEMAVVFQHVWAQPSVPNETMLVDLNLDEAALSAGRRSLVDRGLLFADSRRSDSALSPSLEPTLSAVTHPEVLGVLEIGSPGNAPRSAYISWTREMVVLNQVTQSGDHVLNPLPGVDAIGEAALQFSDLNRYKKAKAEPVPDPETIARRATLRAVFMAVADPAALQPATEAVAWLVSGDGIWLMEEGEGETPRLMPASAAEVGRKVVSMMRAAIEGLGSGRSGAPVSKGNGGSGARTVRSRRDSK